MLNVPRTPEERSDVLQALIDDSQTKKIRFGGYVLEESDLDIPLSKYRALSRGISRRNKKLFRFIGNGIHGELNPDDNFSPVRGLFVAGEIFQAFVEGKILEGSELANALKSAYVLLSDSKQTLDFLGHHLDKFIDASAQIQGKART